jgi:hypothetical protein
VPVLLPAAIRADAAGMVVVLLLLKTAQCWASSSAPCLSHRGCPHNRRKQKTDTSCPVSRGPHTQTMRRCCGEPKTPFMQHGGVVGQGIQTRCNRHNLPSTSPPPKTACQSRRHHRQSVRLAAVAANASRLAAQCTRTCQLSRPEASEWVGLLLLLLAVAAAAAAASAAFCTSCDKRRLASMMESCLQTGAWRWSGSSTEGQGGRWGSCGRDSRTRAPEAAEPPLRHT